MCKASSWGCLWINLHIPRAEDVWSLNNITCDFSTGQVATSEKEPSKTRCWILAEPSFPTPRQVNITKKNGPRILSWSPHLEWSETKNGTIEVRRCFSPSSVSPCRPCCLLSHCTWQLRLRGAWQGSLPEESYDVICGNIQRIILSSIYFDAKRSRLSKNGRKIQAVWGDGRLFGLLVADQGQGW